MIDIVERLRNPSGDIFPMCREAAAEIGRLKEHVVTLQGLRELDRADIKLLTASRREIMEIDEERVAEIERLQDQVKTLHELREYDRKLIEQWRSAALWSPSHD